MNITEIRKKYPQYSDVPDGELVRGLHKKFYSDIPYTDFLKSIDFREKVDPTEGMSTTHKVVAGAGKALTDVARGSGQLVGEAIDSVAPDTSKRIGLPQRSDIDEARALDAPLMDTGAGMAGAIGGGLIPLAALAAVPGANTIAGSALLGGATGLVEPVGSKDSRGKNALVGGVVGGGSAAFLKGLGTVAKNLFGKSATKAAESAARNSVKDATLKAARAEGYVLPPSVAGGGNTSKLLESVGGKAAIGQESALRNQEVTNRLARKAVGLPENAPITEQALEATRKQLAQPYREITAISQKAGLWLEQLKDYRHKATDYFRHYDVSADPNSLYAAKSFSEKAAALETQIEKEAVKAGKPSLVSALREARKGIAKTYDVERALNLGNGNVDAKVIGRMLDKGRPLTGELETIGKFAQSFPHFAREAGAVPTPGVSKLGVYGSIAMGGIGGAATQSQTGSPWGVAAAGLPLLSGPARSIALSKMMQSANQYAPSAALRLSDMTLNNPQLRRLVPLSAVAASLNSEQQ